MKLANLKLFEATKELTPEQLVDQLHKKCGDAVKLYQGLNEKGEALYRGIKPGEFDFKIEKTRKNRNPRDSQKLAHTLFNKGLMQFGNIKWRSSTVFTSLDSSVAADYGEVFIVFPVGNFQMLQSKQIADMYSKLDPNSSGFNHVYHIFENRYASGGITAVDAIEHVIEMDEFKQIADMFVNVATAVIGTNKATELRKILSDIKPRDTWWFIDLMKECAKIYYGYTDYLDNETMTYTARGEYIFPIHEIREKVFNSDYENDTLNKMTMIVTIYSNMIKTAQFKALAKSLYIKLMEFFFSKTMTYVTDPNVSSVSELNIKNEIMIACDSYYLIEHDYYVREIKPLLFGK